jgi:hypothetical protein
MFTIVSGSAAGADEKTRFFKNLRAASAVACAAFIVAAGLVAYLASRYQSCHQLMMFLVRCVDDSLRLTKMSSGSNFPDITAIYDLVVYPLPIFLASYLVLDLAFPLQGRLARPYVFKHYVVAVFAIPLFLFLASVPYWAGHGEDVRLAKFGTHMDQLFLYGWVPFGMSGTFLGISIIIVGKLITRK